MPTTPPMTAGQQLRELESRAAWKAGAIGALNVMTSLLAVRVVLLVSVAGAIALTWLALQVPDPLRLGALGIYCALVAVPTVWLAGRK